MKRVLFLVLSNNDPLTQANEDAVRTTWATRVCLYPNASLYFVKEPPVSVLHDFISGDTIYIAQPEGLTMTYTKMFRALLQIMVNMPDFDYIVRLNTSTWCNVDAVMNFLEAKDAYDTGQVRVFGGAMCMHVDNKFGDPMYEHPYWLGNAFILSKQAVKDILSYGWTWNPALGFDDVYLSYTETRFLGLTFHETFTFYRTVGVEFARYEDDPECSEITPDTFKNCMFIQIKNFLKSSKNKVISSNRSNEPEKMKNVHARWLENVVAPHTISTAILQSRLNTDCLVCTNESLSKIWGDDIPERPYGWHTFPEVRISMTELVQKYPENVVFPVMSYLPPPPAQQPVQQPVDKITGKLSNKQ